MNSFVKLSFTAPFCEFLSIFFTELVVCLIVFCIWLSVINISCNNSNEPSISSNTCTEIPEGFACLRGNLTGVSDYENFTLNVIGQTSEATIDSTNGSYSVLIDITKAGAVYDGFEADYSDSEEFYTLLASDGVNGVRIEDISINAGAEEYLDVVLQPNGSAVGEVNLLGEATGGAGSGGSTPTIHIYVPGTSLSATADENGDFEMELPEGSFYIRITADGYHDAVISDVEIASAEDTVIDINLVLDTGVAASLYTEDTVIIGTKEVEITVIADSLEDAALMMISENANFVNASWVPVESIVDFEFAEYGLNTLYVKF